MLHAEPPNAAVVTALRAITSVRWNCVLDMTCTQHRDIEERAPASLLDPRFPVSGRESGVADGGGGTVVRQNGRNRFKGWGDLGHARVRGASEACGPSEPCPSPRSPRGLASRFRWAPQNVFRTAANTARVSIATTAMVAPDEEALVSLALLSDGLGS